MLSIFRRARRTNPTTPKATLRTALLLPILLAWAALGSPARAQVDVTATAGTPAASYTTLKGAFDAVNAGTHQGVITIGLSGDTTETASAVLNASGAGAAVYTSIAISPTGGAARTISGAIVAGSPLIDLNGADNVTIDGLNTGGNSLTISNTTASATSATSTVRFIGGATNNVITNSNIQGSSSSSVATNGGTIFFSTDAVTANGNDNNTISNNNIGPAGANLPSKAILCNGSTTTTALGNSGIVINNNNIFDYFGAAVTSAGVAANGGCNTWSISNNRLYQTATRTWTTGALHSGINIQNTTATSGAQGFTITGNIVGFASNTQTGTYTLTGAGTGAKFLGIVVNGIVAGTTTNVNNNTVAAVSMTGVTGNGTTTASPFTAILLQEGNFISNGNTIGSQSASGSLTFSTTTTSSTDVYGIFNFSSNAWTSNNNTVGGLSVTNLGASGTFLMMGLRCFTGTTVTWSATGNTVGGSVANSMQLTATGTSSQILGMFTSNAPAVLTSNTIRNLTSNIGTGTTTTASVIGIGITSATPNSTLTQNSVFNLTNTNASAASVVTGIQFNGAAANLVERNLIHSLTVATNSAAAEVNGIRVAGGTTTYRNNMIAVGAGIANAIGTGSTTGGVNGIFEAAGTNSFFHNSVYIGGAPTAGVGPSYAFASTQVTVTRSNRDSVYFNARSNAGSTGKNYAIRVAGTSPNPAGLTLNNNVYFANGTGAAFGFFNSLDVANLAAWKVAVGQDSASIEGDPAFNDPTNATPDLHIHPTNPTVIESNGVDVGVTLDFDGQTRASFTPVDIGADAGNFNGIDLGIPLIVYTPLGNTTSTANRALAATITDGGSGVPTAGIGLPVVYFRKGAVGAFASTQATSAGSGVYNFTIDYSLVSGGSVATGDTIQYYVAAQDGAATPNIAVNPSAGAGGFTANPPAAATPPTTPNSYKIASPISGVKTVCASGCDYTTLTGAAGAFFTLNDNVITGNTELQIAGDLVVGEDGANALAALSEEPTGSNFTLKIYPTGAARAVTGAFNGALVRLSGASRITIDGSIGGVGTDRSLTITNTSVTSPSVVLIGSVGTTPVTNDTLKNCVIVNGVNTSSAVVISDATVLGNAGLFSNITIQNNDIQKAFVGVFATGGTTPQGGSNLVYTQNTLNTSGANAIRDVGLYMQGVNGATVTNNTVGNIDKANDENDAGIWLATGTINATVSGNTISGIGYTGTGAFGAIGINVTSNLASTNNVVSGNSVSDISTNGGSTGSLARGIVVAAGTTSDLTIEKNNVQGIINTSTGTFPAYGLDISGGNNITVRNNFVSNVSFNMTGGAAFSTTFGVFGIRVGAGTGHKIYNNSVNLYGALPGTAASSLLTAAFGITATTSTGLDVRDNVFANNITGGTTSIAHVAAYLPSGGTSAMNLTWNNNAYFFGTDAARQGVGQAGTTAGTNFFTTLPLLAAYTSTLSGAATNDNASQASTGAVPFVSATDLHLVAPTSLTSAAVPLVGVTTDIDGDPRPATTPDIGADEIVAGIMAFSSSTYSDSEAAVTTSITVNRTGGSTGSVSVDYATVAGGTATGGAACTAGVDYIDIPPTALSFGDTVTTQNFSITLCPDALDEPNETVNLAISNPLGGATLGTPIAAVLTINDDDPTPTLSINDVTQVELNSGTSLFGFVVTLSAPSAQTVTVHVQTADGTATLANNDYVAVPDTILTFNPGTTTANVDVTVNGDTAPETNENFFVDLSSAVNASILDNQGVGTISNDDALSGPVTVTATAGTPGPTDYATLKAAFDAINAGTHQGDISVAIVTSVVETATAALNASGSGAALYTSVVVRPANPGVSVTGSIVGAIIKLNGADNVTIDGRVGGIGTARSLTVQNTNTTTATAAIWVSSNGVGAGSTNNVVRNLEIATGPDQSSASTAATFGIIMSGATISATANGDDNDNNQFIFNRIVRARYGIVTRGVTTNLNANPVVADNIIGPSAFGADQIGKVGILMQADTGATVARNVVQFVGCLDPQACTGADRVGIAIGTESWSMAPGTITSNNYTVVRNIIHDVVEETTFSGVGLLLGTTNGGVATNNLVANNILYNVRANGTSGDQAVGLGISGGHSDVVVNNSIAMTGDVDPGVAGASTNFGSGIRIANASSANHANLTLRNNSVYMDLSSSSTAANRFYAISGNAAGYAFGTGGENFNNYYINPSNTQLQTGGLGTTSGSTLTTQFATLANWQAAYTAPQDANSIQANPNHFSPTGDLHILSTSANIDTGTAVAAVTVDIDNEARPNGAAYDIGADEFYPQPGVLQLSSATYSGTEGTTLVLSVTRSGGASGAVGATLTLADVSATGGAACTAGVDYINPGSQVVSLGDTILTQTVNVTLCSDGTFESPENFTATLSLPTGGATLGTPVTATATIVNVAPPFSGSTSVGTGENYASLTNPGGIFEAINNSGLAGNTTINITSDLTSETGAVALNATVGGFSVTFQPSGGAQRVVSGASATPLITLNGADNVTFNGLNTGGNALLLRNTNNVAGVLQLVNDASNNTFTNCTFESGSTNASGGVILIGTGTVTGNDGNTFSSNVIRDRTDAAGVPNNLFVALNGSITITNSSNVLNNNVLRNFNSNGFAASAGLTNDSWTITNNDIFQDASRTTALIGINMGGAAGTNTISGNTIHGLATSGASSTLGMLFGNGATINVSKNRIYNFPGVSGATGAITGIQSNGANGGTPNLTLANNFISIVPAVSTNQVIKGINDFGFAGNIFTAIANSIYIGGTSSGTSASWALVRSDAAPTTFTATDNLAFNNRTGGGANHFGGGDQSANTGTFVSNFNFFAGTGVTPANFMDYGTATAGTAVPFSTWQAGPPTRDANSVANTAGSFVVTDIFVDQDAGDLHIKTTATPVLNAGTSVVGLVDDIDGNPRPVATPDIGADELVQADLAITKTDGVGSVTPGGSTTYTIVASNGGAHDVTGATVADTIPADLTCNWTCTGSLGGTCAASGSGNINDATVNLPAGGSVTYTLSCTVSPSASGSIANTATVSAATSDPNAANNSATDTDTVGAPSADLSITKTDGSASETPGTSVVYTIVASNAGPSPAATATVSDTFAGVLSGCSTTCVGSGGGTCTAGPVAGNLNDTAVSLPVGASVTYTATCNISSTATGSLVNTASVSSATSDPNSGNNSATDTDTLNPSADVSITKADGVTIVAPGSSVTYTIVASNSGPSAAPTVTVADTFAAALTSCSTTCVPAGGASCAAGPLAGNLNTNANLPVGGSATYTATCTLSLLATGTLTNTVTATVGGGVADPVSGNNTATDTDTVDSMPFVDGFESGNTSRWSSTVPLVFEQYAAIDLAADSTDASFTYNFASVAAGRQLVSSPVAILSDAADHALALVVARRTSAAGQLELSLEVAGSANTNWVAVGEVPQQVRVEWSATDASNLGHVAVYLDGRLALWVDGFSSGTPTSVKLLRAPAPSSAVAP